MRSMSQPLLVIVMLVCVLATAWLLTPTIEQTKAERVSIGDASWAVASAALSYIKRHKCPPAAVGDCITIHPAESRQFNKQVPDWLVFVVLEWPPEQSLVVLRSTFDRISLHFPPDPNAYQLQNGHIVSRATGALEPIVRLGDVPAFNAALRAANEYIWVNWLKLTHGNKTGIDWLDNYVPISEGLQSEQQPGKQERPGRAGPPERVQNVGPSPDSRTEPDED